MLFTDELACVQDELCGIRVRADLYRDLQAEEEFYADYVAWEAEQEREREEIRVPFAVIVYCDGLDYDEDGNAYFDDWPSNQVHSCHTTQRGAEMEAAWLIHHGTPSSYVSVDQDVWVERWELKYHPIQEA